MSRRAGQRAASRTEPHPWWYRHSITYRTTPWWYRHSITYRTTPLVVQTQHHVQNHTPGGIDTASRTEPHPGGTDTVSRIEPHPWWYRHSITYTTTPLVVQTQHHVHNHTPGWYRHSITYRTTPLVVQTQHHVQRSNHTPGGTDTASRTEPHPWWYRHSITYRTTPLVVQT